MSTSHEMVLIQLETEDGEVGIGEATISGQPPADDLGPAAIARFVNGGFRQRVVGEPLSCLLERIWTMSGEPLLREAAAGIDTAAWDLQTRDAGTAPSLYRRGTSHGIPVNATVGIREPEPAAEAAQAAVKRGFRTVKLKVAQGDTAEDVRRVALVRKRIGPDVALRVDANGAWDVPTAIGAIEALAPYGIEYVEQPTQDVADMAAVRRAVSVPIAADEAVRILADVHQVLEAEAADVLVVKPLMVGGITPAIAIVKSALDAGKRVVVTSSIDSGVGVAAALQVAALLPEPIPACGLATLDLLEDDLLLSTLAVENGHMTLPPGRGLGVTLDEEAIERYRLEEAR